MRATSPLRTGDAGGDFETDVGAVYLVALLLGGSARGASDGGVVQVTFQQGSLGAPLDDLVIQTEASSGSRLRLDLQVKRTFTFSPGDREFLPVLEKSWDTFRAFGFRDRGHRLGVALGHFPAKLKEHYVRVPVWAVTSPSAEHFFDRISTDGLSSKEMRGFVSDVSDHLRSYAPTEATDDSLWHFFRSLAIVDFDLDQPASRDRMFAIELLRTLVPAGDLAAAETLFSKLTAQVREAKKTAGGYTAETLRERLLGTNLLPSKDLQRDIQRLANDADLALRSIRNTIGGLVLDRGDLVGEVLQQAEQGKTVLLLGAPGAGKSALARAVGEIYRVNGPILALSSERLNESMAGWAGLASTLQLQGSLKDIVWSLSGTTRPCFILDGADRIEGNGPRRVINDLLDSIGRLSKDPEGRSRWGEVITLRSEMLGSVEEWLDLAGRDVEILNVPGLSEGDLTALANERPHLAQILAAPQVGPVVHNPYFLRILEEVRARAPESSDRPVTEAEVHDLWWHRFVGKNQDRGRQQLLLQLGEEWLARHVRRFPNRDLAPDILNGLERDDILRYHRTTDSFVFGHDLLEEWTAVRVLGQREPDVLGYLQQLGNPFWARRSLQLLACLRLEGENGVERWKDLLVAAEGLPEASSRWTDAVLTAPFRSARLQELMPGVGEILLENGGSRLLHFLRALRTQAIEPNRKLEKMFREASERTTPRGEALLLELGEPEEAQWIPVLSWLAPRLLDLPGPFREEASKVMAIWERATRSEGFFRREIAEAALAWRSPLRPIDGRRPYVGREAELYFNRLRDIATSSADAVPERIPEIFAHLLETETNDNLRRWLAAGSVQSLVERAPEAYADFTLDVLIPEWRQGRPPQQQPSPHARFSYDPYEDLDPEWRSLNDDHAFHPESHLRGPFLFILLTDEAAGLHLVNRATAGRIRETKLRGYSTLEPQRIVLNLPAGRRSFLGGRGVYRWFRPMGEAPDSVCCALMALEVWMEKQIESGREPEELFSTVLATSTSIATVAVCVAISLAYPEKCLQAAIPFVTHPSLWDYDLTRFSADIQGTFSLNQALGMADFAEQAALERDHRPQRKAEIRQLAGVYVFSRDQDLSAKVVSKVRKFRDKSFAAYADPANYQRAEDGTIWFVPPAKLLRHHQHSIQHLAAQSRYLELSNWVHEIDKPSPNLKGFSIAQAIERAKELLQPDDFESPLSKNSEEFERLGRLGAIVGAVTAVLRLDLPGVSELGQLRWCEEVLIAAAQTPCEEKAGWRSVLPDDFVLAAARGLLILLENGHASERARQTFFDLLQRPEKEIVDFVFSKISALWDLEPVFCRNVVARELALAVEPWREKEEPESRWDTRTPKADTKVQEIKNRYATNIRENRPPVSISLNTLTPESRFKTRYVERALGNLPLDRLASTGDLPWVLEATERALTWTLRQVGFQDYNHPSRDWLTFFGDWLARLSRHLQSSEVERMILRPLQEGWPRTARLMEEVLVGWTKHRLLPSDQLSEESKQSWRALAETVLASSEQPRPSLRDRVLELLLHVRNGRAFLNEHWSGASEFLDLYDRWVEMVAPTPWGFSRLLVFLNAAGKSLSVDRAVRWVTSAVARSTEPDKLWREEDNLSRTAEWLAGLWERAEEQIRREPAIHASYASLLDELVRAGSPLAEQLRRAF